jgi:hypothetical protein
MHFIIRLLALCALMPYAARAEAPVLPLPWQKVTEFYVTPSPSRMYGPANAVYVQTGLPAELNEGPQTRGVWHTVDLASFGVPSDAVAAFLSGLLIITGGEVAEVADLRVVFRRPGDTTPCTKYLGQTSFQTNVVPTPYGNMAIGGGQRSNMATWVPLADGKFEFCYQVSTGGAWPTNPSYGINLSLQAWAR